MIKAPKARATLLAIACSMSLAVAAASATSELDLPAGELGAALKALASQLDVELVYQPEAIRGVRTEGVKGSYSAEQAVELLLKGTSLELRMDASGAMVIAPRGPGASRAGADLQESTSRDDGITEVLVTGRKPFTDGNMDIVRTRDDAQPYHIIDKEQIQKSGATDVEGFLKNHLTMNTVALTNQQRAASPQGTHSTINLRGVGANQTLILINGRRTSNIVLNGVTSQPDVNGIPLAAVERIEVLPVSSAAIYGGSAIGGVVNVVLKRNYEGANLALTYKNMTDVDAPIRTVDGSVGVALEDGKTHLMIGARYSEADPLLNRDRPELFERGLRRVMQNNPSLLLSPTAPFVGATPNIASVNGANLVLRPQYGGTNLGSNITYVPTGTSAATSAATLGAGLLANAGSYNLDMADAVSNGGRGLLSPVVGAPETKSVIASGRRQMSDRVEAFMEFYHSETASESMWANNGPYIIDANSPINPFTQSVRISVPDSEATAYLSENEVTRATAGVLVNLPHEWQAEGDYTWTRNKNRYSAPLLDTILSLPAAFANGTVNPFVDVLANPLAVDFYRGTFGSSQTGGLDNIAVRLAGPLFELPAGYPTLAIGVEHRKETMEGDGRFVRAFPNTPAASLVRHYLPKSQSISSIYTELKVPLIAAANDVPLVRELELQLAARSERFSVSTGTSFVDEGTTTTIVSNEVDYTSTNPTFGLRYKPMEGLMLRASYATGFLPPDYAQFLTPTLGGTSILGANATTNVIDPLRGNQLTAVHYLTGGNPNIDPQNSESWSVGMVLQPTFFKGFRASLEWYRLTQKDVVVTPSAQQIVDLESALPGRVTRAAAIPGDGYAVGPITLVDYSLLNANRAQTEGIDFTMSYRFPSTRFGAWQLGLAGTTIRSFERQTTVTSALTDIVGQVANDGPLKHKGNVSLSWMRGGWKADWVMSYFGSYRQYDVGGISAYVLAQGSNKIPSQSYHDATLEYSWLDGENGSWQQRAVNNLTVQLGILNVFNEVPPFDAYYSTYQYYSPFGNPRLREYRVSVAKRFW